MALLDSHGSYDLIECPPGSLASTYARLAIRRRDADHPRTVAFLTSTAQWERFVAALETGADEVAAVHAIDAERAS